MRSGDENSPILLKYLRIYEADPKSLVFAALAECYRKIGLYDKAIEIIKKGFRYHPDYVLAHLTLAQCYRDLEQYSLAYETLKPYVTSHRDNVRMQKLYAFLASQKGFIEESVQTYKCLLFINPKDEEVAVELKKLEDKISVIQEANLPLLERSEVLYAIAPRDEDEENWTQIRLTSDKNAEFNETQNESILQFIPKEKMEESEGPSFTLVDLYLESGKKDKAKELLEKMEILLPHHLEIQKRLSQMTSLSEKEKKTAKANKSIKVLQLFAEKMRERAASQEISQ